MNDDESLSVMINEEDHIRIQAMGTDTTLQALYNQASSIDDELDRSLDISYDEQLGFNYMSYQYRYWYESKRDATFTRSIYYEKNDTDCSKPLIVLDIQSEVFTVKVRKFMDILIGIQPTYTW